MTLSFTPLTASGNEVYPLVLDHPGPSVPCAQGIEFNRGDASLCWMHERIPHPYRRAHASILKIFGNLLTRRVDTPICSRHDLYRESMQGAGEIAVTQHAPQRPLQQFTDEYLERCRSLSPAPIVRFLDDYRMILDAGSQVGASRASKSPPFEQFRTRTSHQASEDTQGHTD